MCRLHFPRDFFAGVTMACSRTLLQLGVTENTVFCSIVLTGTCASVILLDSFKSGKFLEFLRFVVCREKFWLTTKLVSSTQLH